VHKRQLAAGWRDAVAMEEGSVPRLGTLPVQSYVQASSIQAGSVVVAAEEKKTQKYSNILSDVDFSPFTNKTAGLLKL